MFRDSKCSVASLVPSKLGFGICLSCRRKEFREREERTRRRKKQVVLVNGNNLCTKSEFHLLVIRLEPGEVISGLLV